MTRLIIICMCALPLLARAAHSIPSSRIYDWTGRVGVPGGIPDSSAMTVFTNNLNPTGWAQIQSHLGSCPSNQVVQLGPGTFGTFSSRLDFQGVGNGKVLKGTRINGTNATKIICDGFIPILMRSSYSSGASANQTSNLVADAAMGSTTLTFAATPSWVTVGGIYFISQLNDVTNVVDDVADTCREGAEHSDVWDSDRGMAQFFRVTAKDATTVTIDNPLFANFYAAFTAQIKEPGIDFDGGSNFRYRCGIEDIDLEYSELGTDHFIKLENAAQCWIKGVNIHMIPNNAGIYCVYAYQCEFRENTVYDSWAFNAGQGYGIDLHYGSCFNLIEDNILRRLHVAVQLSYGSSCNVIAYNYELEGTADAGNKENDFVAFHGCVASANLVEGNVAEEKVMSDCIHGVGGFNNTIFRNHVQGVESYEGGGVQNQRAITIDHLNRLANIAGNVLGKEGLHTTYQFAAPEDCSEPNDPSVLSFGYANADNCGWSSGCFTYYTNLLVFLDWNYDTVTATNDGLVLDGTIVGRSYPDSYFRASRPEYFGGLTWPAISPTNASYSMSFTNIPAGYRYIHGTNPPSSFGGGDPPPDPPAQVQRARIRPA